MSDTDQASANLPEFERWANIYSAHQAFGHPSELHGSLCGRLAAGDPVKPQAWMSTACEQMGVAPETAESPALADFLEQAHAEALDQFKAADMSFQLLLPDEDYALEQRLLALSSWVRGFLEGMASTAGAALGEAPEEIRELIEDLVAISQVAETEDESEEGEVQFTEIVEYVRLGALSVYTEFNPPAPRTASGETLH